MSTGIQLRADTLDKPSASGHDRPSASGQPAAGSPDGGHNGPVAMAVPSTLALAHRSAHALHVGRRTRRQRRTSTCSHKSHAEHVGGLSAAALACTRHHRQSRVARPPEIYSPARAQISCTWPRPCGELVELALLTLLPASRYVKSRREQNFGISARRASSFDKSESCWRGKTLSSCVARRSLASQSTRKYPCRWRRRLSMRHPHGEIDSWSNA